VRDLRVEVGGWVGGGIELQFEVGQEGNMCEREVGRTRTLGCSGLMISFGLIKPSPLPLPPPLAAPDEGDEADDVLFTARADKGLRGDDVVLVVVVVGVGLGLGLVEVDIVSPSRLCVKLAR
jgi:hypothetical protein